MPVDTQEKPAAPAVAKQKPADPNPQAPKYSREESAKAEAKVHENNEKARTERNKKVQQVMDDLAEAVKDLTPSDKTNVLQDLQQRISSVSTIAAAPHLRPDPAKIRDMETVMPALTPPTPPGETPRRNLGTMQKEELTPTNKEAKK